MHEADRIVELVRDARDELAQRLHLLALHELRLDLAQLARALLDARLERLVELRDLVEGLGVLDRDRALVGERAQQLAIVGGEAIARELAPDRDHAEQIDAEEDRDEQLDLERVEDVAAGFAHLEIGLVVEIDARELLAPHPEVLPDRDGRWGSRISISSRLPVRRAQASARSSALSSSSSSTIARSTPIVSVSATRMRSAISLDREHRDHRLGDLAHRLPVAARSRSKKRSTSACMRSRSRIERAGSRRKSSATCGGRAFTPKRATSASAKVMSEREERP